MVWVGGASRLFSNREYVEAARGWCGAGEMSGSLEVRDCVVDKSDDVV